MKKHTLSIISLILSIHCFGQEILPVSMGLTSKPKKMEVLNYSTYNWSTLTAENRFSSKEIYEFNDKGNVIIMSTNYKPEDASASNISNFIYDENENLKQILENDSLGTNYSYNKQGQCILQEYGSGDSKWTIHHAYDQKEHTEKITRSNSKETTINTYDATWEKIIESKTIDENKNPVYRSVYSYDSNGNGIKMDWYDSKDLLQDYYVTHYNKYNHETKIEKYRVKDKDTSLTKILELKYEYDDKGNFTREELYRNDILITIKKRKITY